MKLKSKLLLIASAALVISGAAAGTSTFAWYTANRVVGSEVTTIGVRAETTSLSIGVDSANTDTAFTNTGSGASSGLRLTSNTTTAISDISGIGSLSMPSEKASGHAFVKPYVNSTGTKCVGWYSKADVANNFYMITYNFVVAGSNKVNLFLSHNSTIVDNEASSTNVQVKKDVRFSALSNTYTATASGGGAATGSLTDVVTVTASSQLFYADVSATASTDTYAKGAVADASGTLLTGLTTSAVGGTSAIQALGNDNFFGAASGFNDYGDYLETPTTSLGYLCTLNPADATKFASVTFLFWIEGETTDLTSVALDDFSGAFTANLNFYTSRFKTV